MKKSMLTLLFIAPVMLAGCTSTQIARLNADIQEATTISCVLDGGIQVAYTVGTQVANAVDYKNQNVLQVSTKIANGSAAMCAALIKINSQIIATSTVPTPTSTLVMQPTKQ